MPQDPGIGTGVGGLFASMFNPGLATRVAQHITPNPNPLAQQGGPAAPGSVDSLGNPSPSGPPPGSNLAPAAVTQPDPVNASYAADLMRYDRMNKLSDDLNRNIQGVAAGFGTAQQQASKTAALGQGGGVGDSLGALAGIQGMQDKTIQDNEHARFQAGADMMGQQILGLKPGQGAWLASSGKLPDIIQTHLANQEPTEAVKTWTQIRDVLRKQGMSEDDINTQVPPTLIMGAGLANLGDRQFLVGQAQAVAANKKDGTPIPPQYQGDLANYNNVMRAQGELQTEHAKDLAESQGKFGDQIAKSTEVEQITNGIQGATEIDPTTGKQVSVLQAIMNDPLKKAAAVSLMKESDTKGAGPVGNFIGSGIEQGLASRLTPEEQDAVAKLKQLSSSTYATAFTSTGSRRTQQEVSNIASSLSQLGNMNQSYGSYMDAFNNLHHLNQVGMANAYGAAQRLDEVPDNLKPLVSSMYLPAQFDSKGNQIRAKGALYTGAGGDWATKAAEQQPTQPTQTYPAPSSSAIEKLKAHPELAPKFDEKFGPGASKQVLGQ